MECVSNFGTIFYFFIDCWFEVHVRWMSLSLFIDGWFASDTALRAPLCVCINTLSKKIFALSVTNWNEKNLEVLVNFGFYFLSTTVPVISLFFRLFVCFVSCEVLVCLQFVWGADSSYSGLRRVSICSVVVVYCHSKQY